jgi:Family of unknown function (DUF5640)
MYKILFFSVAVSLCLLANVNTSFAQCGPQGLLACSPPKSKLPPLVKPTKPKSVVKIPTLKKAVVKTPKPKNPTFTNTVESPTLRSQIVGIWSGRESDETNASYTFNSNGTGSHLHDGQFCQKFSFTINKNILTKTITQSGKGCSKNTEKGKISIKGSKMNLFGGSYTRSK